jgi:protein-S-isoprenylcysteine O-methyltransferase Ste14
MLPAWDGPYRLLLMACWGLLALVWVVGALYNLVRAPRAERSRGRFGAWLVAIVLLVAGSRLIPPRVWPALTVESVPLRVAGAAILLAATVFTLWARVVLGTMWTSIAVIKTDHQLRTTGPYAITRHPIYTGILSMLAGTMLLSGFGICTLYFLAGIVGLKLKASQEEQLLEETFGERYREYRRRVPQLVPPIRPPERKRVA